MQDNFIFPPSLVLRALKSGPYKNTAHAVAELVDNSVDAKAKQVGIALLVDQDNGQLHTIAVLDDGTGMSAEELRKSVQYGCSLLKSSDDGKRKPLGKYGVGLVAASFSQCSDLQVYSWQKGEPANGKALATTIRLPSKSDKQHEIKNELPTPEMKQLPPWASRAFRGMPSPLSVMPTGTLVVWTRVEPHWKKPETLRKNLSNLCGRIYRELLPTKLNISISIFNIKDKDSTADSKIVQPIDPLFLRTWDDPAFTPPDFFKDNTLFVPHTGHSGDSGKNQLGDYEAQLYEVKIRGEVKGAYLIMASYRNPKVGDDPALKEYDDPGDAPYGKLAKKLQGVSIMRSGREIALDPNWLRVSQSLDRWLSVSVDFDPDLDDVFGVSSDKQNANRLASYASMNWEEIKNMIRSLEKEDDRDERALACLRVAGKIKELLREMSQIVKRQRKGSRTSKDNETQDPSKATDSELRQTGDKLSSGPNEVPYDKVNPKDDPEGTTRVYEGSTSDGVPAEHARPAIVMEKNLKIDAVMDEHSSTPMIFRVSQAPGHLLVHLTARHPLSSVLSQLLTPSDELPEGAEPPTIRHAVRVLRSLLFSYARAQVEAAQESVTAAADFERCALRWGEVAARTFEDEDEE